MFNLFDRRAKTAPAQYPRLVFHGIRAFQLLASVVVGGIMSYFMYILHHDDYSIPWTFIWLTAASLFSIVAQFITIIFHCVSGLHPHFNLSINSFLAVLWTLSWSLLTWFMSGTLLNSCDIAHWNEESGVTICRLYKALFAFTLLGAVTTVSALILDIYVHRQVTRRGVYRLPDNDSKARPQATRGPYSDHLDTDAMDDRGRVSEAWEAPRESSPYVDDSHIELQQPKNGYTVPEHQFEHDTQYRGGAGDGGRFYDQSGRI